MNGLKDPAAHLPSFHQSMNVSSVDPITPVCMQMLLFSRIRFVVPSWRGTVVSYRIIMLGVRGTEQLCKYIRVDWEKIMCGSGWMDSLCRVRLGLALNNASQSSKVWSFVPGPVRGGGHLLPIPSYLSPPHRLLPEARLLP